MATEARRSFGAALRECRRARGTSQLDLGLGAGVSARHLSFLETGRSRPSRDMVLRLSEALGLPLRQRNELLLAAGFAPSFPERPLDDAALVPVREALDFILRMNEPYPAFVLDRSWDILRWNRPHAVLLGRLLPGADLSGMNAFELVFDRGLLRDRLDNWSDVAGALLRRLRRQLASVGPDPDLERLWALGTSEAERAGLALREPGDDEHELLVPLRFRLDGKLFSWLTTLASFGNARDVTVEELVIECFYPADEPTRLAVQSFSPPP